MTKTQRLNRMDELRKELIELEVEDQFERGWQEGIPKKDLKEVAAIAYILTGEAVDPIGLAVEIKQGQAKLTGSGQRELNILLKK